MRFSLSVSTAAAAAALLLAACAGRGVVPSAGSYAPPLAGVDAKKTTNPCTATQTAWVFGGACGTVKLLPTGGTGSLPSFLKITVSATFPKGTQKSGTVLVVRDAGPANVTGKINGQTFPPYNKFGQLALTPYLYLKATNTGAALQFTGTPKIVLTSTTLPKLKPGKHCFLQKMTAPTGNAKWAWNTVNIGLAGYLSGDTLEFGTFSQPQIVPAGGTIYLAISCEE
jgi:hypothetical protein